MKITHCLKWMMGILVLLPSIVFADAAKLTEINVSNGGSSARLEFFLSQPTKYHVFTLDNPDRLVIDLMATKLATNLQKVALGNSPLKMIRSGHPEPQRLRLVLDLKKPIKFENYAQSNKIMLDVYAQEEDPTSSQELSTGRSSTKSNSTKTPSTKANSTKSGSTKGPSNRLSSSKPNATGRESTKSGSTKSGSTKPNARRADEPLSQAKPKPAIETKSTLPTIVVVIDPGHGGKDPGAIGESGTKEKNVVLSIARHLAILINHQPHMRAVLTRKGDYFVPLRGRLKLARKGKGDLFVSIHADSFYDDKSTGISIYALSHHGATTEAARWLAKRENTSELGGVDLGELGDKSVVLRSVLIDLAQTATITDSLRLGSAMLQSLDQVTELHYTRVEQAPFMVLKSPDIPSILVETGFISNPTEEAKLRDEAYQTKIAQALFNGIQIYFKKYSTIGV